MANTVSLRDARLRAGLTQAQLAGALGISSATLSRAESGSGSLTTDRLSRAAKALGVPVDELDAVAARDRDEGRSSASETPGTYAAGEPGAWRDFQDLVLSPPLQAALSSFLRLGYHGSAVRDLAKEAGLSVPGLYHHYESKQSLLVAIMDLTMNDFRDRCVAAREEGGADPTRRFMRLVECYALFHTYRRELAFIGASEMRSLEDEPRDRIAGIRVECQHMVTEEVEIMAAQNALGNPYPEDAARAVVTMLVGIANWYRIDGPLTPEQIARQYITHSVALIQLAEAQQIAVLA